MSFEELARGVINKSVGDQLMMLKDFYKSKFQETEAIYQPLLEVYTAKQMKNQESPEKSKKRKTGEGPAVTVRVNKARPLVLSSESASEDKPDVKSPKKTKKKDKKPRNNRSAALNATLSR